MLNFNFLSFALLKSEIDKKFRKLVGWVRKYILGPTWFRSGALPFKDPLVFRPSQNKGFFSEGVFELPLICQDFIKSTVNPQRN